MAYTKSFSDIGRSEFQAIYNGMGATDKLYFRVGNDSSDTIDDAGTECVQSTDKSSLTTYVYSKTYYAPKSDCGDALNNTTGDITRKSENATSNIITDDD